VQNSLGLAGVTPEEQQIVTGAVLIVTLAAFNAYGFIGSRMADLWRARRPARQRKDPREPGPTLTAMVGNVTVQADGSGRPSRAAQIVHPPGLGDPG
jgi:hypothetical protein